jgi:hypothetical protein
MFSRQTKRWPAAQVSSADLRSLSEKATKLSGPLAGTSAASIRISMGFNFSTIAVVTGVLVGLPAAARRQPSARRSSSATD